MDNKVECYKRKNAELAIKLNEKRIEIQSKTNVVMEQEREIQLLQEENSQLKLIAAKHKQQLETYRSAVMETIKNNTMQYSKLMSMSSFQLSGQNTIPGSSGVVAVTAIASPDISSQTGQSTHQPTANRPDLPKIIITTPAAGTNQPFPQQPPEGTDGTIRVRETNPEQRHRKIGEATHESPSRPPIYSPFGLSLIAEENTIDLEPLQSFLDSFPNNGKAHDEMFSSTLITTAEMSTPDRMASEDEDRMQATQKIPRKDLLASVENIEKQKRTQKPVPLSIQILRKDKQQASENCENAKPKSNPKHQTNKNAAKKSTPTTDEAAGRPKRRAAPQTLVEPKVNTKMRR